MNSEQQYLALCDDVIRQAVRIAAKCATSGAPDAGNLAAALVENVNSAKQRRLMQQERASGYDLSALTVHADVASNSETPFEDED